jgi:hypothetical protein
MMYKARVTVRSESHTKHKIQGNFHAEFLNVKPGGYCAGDKIEKNGMGGACSAWGGEERCVQGFGGGT